MSLAGTSPIRFSPAGLSDTLDETDAFPGAMALLQNLIPDPTTKNLWTCRPASSSATTFGGFAAPGFVSVFKVIGSLVYGMIASSRTAARDEPFCYNLLTNAFVTVSGITAANVPLSPSTSGDWTPPTMDLVGVNLVVTHSGFDGVTNFIGWFDTTDPTAPVWHAGNITGAIVLTVVPSWVRQFNGRAYLGVNPPTGQPSAIFTDSLTLNVTNANQALTFGDNIPLIAACGMPLSNQLGGIIQALFIFKGAAQNAAGGAGIVQITGDSALSTLSLNTLNVSAGTLAPRSIVSAPDGLFFMDHDGLRMIDYQAKVHEPIGVGGAGVNQPFLNPISPSRIAAATNGSVLRISVENSNIGGTPTQEYWLDLNRKVWSGPHTFPADCIDTYGSEFVLAPTGVPGALFLGPYIPTPVSGNVENGVAMTFMWQTAMLADNEEMAMSEIAEMQLKTSAIPGTPSIQVSAIDENGNVYNTFSYNYAVMASLWGSMVWGTDTWGGVQGGIAPRRISFDAPVVYNRLAVLVSGACSQGFQIGDMFIRRRVLGYMQVVP